MCDYCREPIGKDIDVNKSPLLVENQPDKAFIMSSSIMLLKNSTAYGFIDVNYCPFCGRELNYEVIR